VGSKGAFPVARAGVDLAVRFLPELDDRLRYRAEFLAELHDLSPAAQLRWTAGCCPRRSLCAPRWVIPRHAPRRTP
jgi:hypothetical protein